MMATHAKPVPAWHSFTVATFAGASDTHIGTGEDYRSITLASIFENEPTARPKMSGGAFLASSYCSFDARSHEVQREQGSFVALVGDIDKGNLTLSAIRAATERFAGGSAWLVYSSAHSRPGDLRWRIVFPLEKPCAFAEWYDAQMSLFSFMESADIPMDHALSRAGQPIYLPNVPPAYKDGTKLRGEDGKALYYQSANSGLDANGLDLAQGIVAGGISTIRQRRIADDREREALRKMAAAKRAEAPVEAGATPREHFNSTTSIETMLVLCDYEQCPRHPEDWRSPQQTGDTYATQIIENKWVSLSASDAASGLGCKCRSGCFGDAFDLYVHYKHSGSHADAYRAINSERKGSSVVYANFRSEPDDPGWQEIPDSAYQTDDEPDYEISIVPPEVASVAKASNSPLPLEWFEDLEPQLHGLWLMKGLLPAQGICIVHGHPGSGKTFLALTWAMYVALGWEWQGRKVKQGLVVYLSAEGQRGLKNRIAAFKQHHNVTKAPVAIIPVAIDMQAVDADVNRLIEAVKAAEEHYGEQAAMVVIDTVSKTFGAGKENTDDMVSYVSNCERVAVQFECLTVAIHHRPKDAESEDPRGHSSLKGGSETVILIEAGETKKARVSKQKDGEDGLEMLFKLKVIDLGLDEDGEKVTSCIVEDAQMAAQPRFDEPEAKVQRMPDNYRRVLQVLDDTAITSGMYPPQDIPESQINRMKVGKVVSFEDWRELYLKTAGQDPDTKPDTLSKTFRRALTRLQNDGIVKVYGEYAWRTWEARTLPDTCPDTDKNKAGQTRTLGGTPKGVTPAVSGCVSGLPGETVRPESDWENNPLLNSNYDGEPPAWMDEAPPWEEPA